MSSPPLMSAAVKAAAYGPSTSRPATVSLGGLRSSSACAASSDQESSWVLVKRWVRRASFTCRTSPSKETPSIAVSSPSVRIAASSRSGVP